MQLKPDVPQLLSLVIFLCHAGFLSGGDFVQKEIRYTLDGEEFVGTIVYSDEEDEARPGILMVPNWMGPTPNALDKAMKVADDDFVVMVVDMYGVSVRPQNGGEAGKAAGSVRADRNLMRSRAAKALAEFLAVEDIPLDRSKIGAIGFCFGGGVVLELGRAGADLDAIVSFHGDLVSPTLQSDAEQTKASVLVLHGADDPAVSQEDVSEFISVMRKTTVDWQLVQFSGTVHSFTNPEADRPGRSQYNARSAERAFELMEELLEEGWDLDD